MKTDNLFDDVFHILFEDPSMEEYIKAFVDDTEFLDYNEAFELAKQMEDDAVTNFLSDLEDLGLI